MDAIFHFLDGGTTQYFLILMAGVAYGFLVGLIPVAGATTGLIAIYSFVTYFQDPYMLVVFTTAVVVTSSIGDSFCGIVMNIPGAGGAATAAAAWVSCLVRATTATPSSWSWAILCGTYPTR